MLHISREVQKERLLARLDDVEKQWKFKPADSAADFSFHWRLIVGHPYEIRRAEIPDLAKQLRDCRVVLSRDGKVMDRGVGSTALDHPALALAFLADIVAHQPRFDALAAGEVISTGTLTAALPISAGENWESQYSGLPVTGLRLTLSA